MDLFIGITYSPYSLYLPSKLNLLIFRYSHTISNLSLTPNLIFSNRGWLGSLVVAAASHYFSQKENAIGAAVRLFFGELTLLVWNLWKSVDDNFNITGQLSTSFNKIVQDNELENEGFAQIKKGYDDTVETIKKGGFVEKTTNALNVASSVTDSVFEAVEKAVDSVVSEKKTT